ncbi:hypothetical protein C8J57DRAFT_1508187 [Mycena rebaudengoi]|nr:hypothetical protein C8J57DRAFT_1508187 [Mycena rebaudengoi]
MADLSVLQNTLIAIVATLQQLAGGQNTGAAAALLLNRYLFSLRHRLPRTPAPVPRPFLPQLVVTHLHPIFLPLRLTNQCSEFLNSGFTWLDIPTMRACLAAVHPISRPSPLPRSLRLLLDVSKLSLRTFLPPSRWRLAGDAVSAYSQPQSPPTLLETVSFIDAATGTRMMRIRLEVLPYPKPTGSDLILCRRLRTSEVGFLKEHNLLYNFVLPESPSLPDLLRMGAREMQEGPRRFRFDANTGVHASRHLPHETLPLQILSLVNKGNPRTNGVSYLTSRHPFRLDTTNFNGDQ